MKKTRCIRIVALVALVAFANACGAGAVHTRTDPIPATTTVSGAPGDGVHRTMPEKLTVKKGGTVYIAPVDVDVTVVPNKVPVWKKGWFWTVVTFGVGAVVTGAVCLSGHCKIKTTHNSDN